jgi:transcriptional regulator with AAA-type ATPase domain
VNTEERTTPPDEPPISLLPQPAEIAPALVIVWASDEPARIGEVAVFPELGLKMILGRGDDGGPRRTRFLRQRPRVLEPRPAIASSGISREQLLVLRRTDGLYVERRGLPALLVNGARCENALLRAGDTLEIERRMLFLCTARVGSMPALRFARLEGGFGEPDAHGILGESPVAWKLREDLAFVREAFGHVLITGESGTGKELAARAIHASSRRGPLVAHNAATFPAGLIDAELFGNPKNYPNPGMPERPGLVGEADGGVLFLDEIGELPPELHARLLRVLDADGEYKRLGETMTRTSDFRLVAATNRDPSVLKHDLLSRLRVRVALPSLRERREDVPLLARAIVLDAAKRSPVVAGRFVREVGGRLEPKISAALMDRLVRWPYTTNVREIAVLLSCAMAQSLGSTLTVPKEMEPPATAEAEPVGSAPSEESQLRAALEPHRNVARAGLALGVSRQAVYRMMAKYGMGDG